MASALTAEPPVLPAAAGSQVLEAVSAGTGPTVGLVRVPARSGARPAPLRPRPRRERGRAVPGAAAAAPGAAGLRDLPSRGAGVLGRRTRRRGKRRRPSCGRGAGGRGVRDRHGRGPARRPAGVPGLDSHAKAWPKVGADAVGLPGRGGAAEGDRPVAPGTVPLRGRCGGGQRRVVLGRPVPAVRWSVRLSLPCSRDGAWRHSRRVCRRRTTHPVAAVHSRRSRVTTTTGRFFLRRRFTARTATRTSARSTSDRRADRGRREGTGHPHVPGTSDRSTTSAPARRQHRVNQSMSTRVVPRCRRPARGSRSPAFNVQSTCGLQRVCAAVARNRKAGRPSRGQQCPASSTSCGINRPSNSNTHRCDGGIDQMSHFPAPAGQCHFRTSIGEVASVVRTRTPVKANPHGEGAPKVGVLECSAPICSPAGAPSGVEPSSKFRSSSKKAAARSLVIEYDAEPNRMNFASRTRRRPPALS